jgi:hypothetical protein
MRALSLGAVVWLYLDRYQAPGWLIGSVATIFALLMIGVVYNAIQEKEDEPLYRSDVEKKTESKLYQDLWNRGKMS